MGRSSSSSRRKKRSKVRTQKRSKIGKRKYETKKLRRHVSEDDDDSRSSISGSSHSSSSEDSKYSSKNSRVRIRKHVASRKKKSRKFSYSSESSEDSRRGRKKRVGSKRKCDRENKNKMYSSKKRRRHDSVCSTSRSSSCSTCWDDSIGNGSPGIRSERYGKRHGKEERGEGNLEKVESALRRSRYRPRSPSCCEQSETSEYGMKEKVVVEKISRRLRSVITVVHRDEEGGDFSRDEHKEEIVYDHDDYPSCRSNDSNDTGRYREEGDNDAPIDREKKIRLENEKGDNAVVSSFRPHKRPENGSLSDGNGGSEFGKANATSDRMSDVSRSVGEMKSDDLESVLRLRALENLRRFRGVIGSNGRSHGNQKGQIDGDSKHSSFSNAELVPIRSADADEVSKVAVCAKSTKDDGPEVVFSTKSQLATGINVPAPKKTFQTAENRTDGNTDGNESALTKQKFSSTNRTEDVGNTNDKIKVGISVAKPKLIRPALTSQLSKSISTLNQSPRRQETKTELLATGSNNSDEAGAVTTPTLIHNPEHNSIDTTEPPSTSSEKAKDEANEGFEQKTMSVMRGGEMVQVSYKVYIPKKVPALARRQLKR